MKIILKDGKLTVFFMGELDNLAILHLKVEAMETIGLIHAKKVCFDFSEVSFIDSTGIGFILARYNQIKEYGGQLSVSGCSTSVRRLFALSGVFSIIEEEELRQGVKL